MKRFCFLVLLVWIGFGRIHTASAHGSDAGQLSILIDNVNAAILFSPYVTAFPFADDDGDGLLSFDEYSKHQDAINISITEGVVLRNEMGEAAVVGRLSISPPESEAGGSEPAGFEFIKISMQAAWPTVPEVIDVEYTLFGSAETRVHYLMQDNDSEETDVIEGEFSSAEPLIRLRGEGTPTQTGSTIWLSGVEHVLSGYDHILFILALVLATAGLRKLIGPLTAFTVAHTITLGAIAFGFEPPVPAWLIEAIIAASIAILAGIYLLNITADVWWVTALLGLVHGLGFGQAMTASLGSLQEWGTTLIAITVGVELTHLAIALLGIGVLRLVRTPRSLVIVRRTASLAILCVGLYWTVERLPI